MLTSVGCYVAIALIIVALVFPETLNHSYLDSSAVLLQTLKGLLTIQDEILSADPHDVLPGTLLVGKVNEARVGAIQQLQGRMYPLLMAMTVPDCWPFLSSYGPEGGAQLRVHMG